MSENAIITATQHASKMGLKINYICTSLEELNLKIKPKRGLLIGWNNLYINGFPNYKTMHEALPPIKGSKYIITKWWRSWSLI